MTLKFKYLFLLTIITTSIVQPAEPQKTEVQATEPTYKFSAFDTGIKVAICGITALSIAITLFDWKNQYDKRTKEIQNLNALCNEIAVTLQLNTSLWLATIKKRELKI